jgi:hypothetical protein
MINQKNKTCIICNSLIFSEKKSIQFHRKKYCSKKCKQKQIDLKRKNNLKIIENRRKIDLNFRNKNLDKRRKAYRDWCKTERGKFLRRISASMRHKRLKKCTPPWVNKNKIFEIYKQCQEMNTNEKKYSVDHIWPLKNKNFCGLHVPWNLRIITIKENCSKCNKIPV